MADTTDTVQAKRANHGVFMYSEGAATHADAGAARFASDIVALAPLDLVAAMERQRREGLEFWYFVSPLRECAPTVLEDAASEWRDLLPTEGGLSEASVWMGGAGSTTQAHYDVAHGALVQLHGRKRVLLWRPAAHADLRVFPDAHARARKAQRGVDEACRATADVDVVLEPGQGLTIPAFWFHHCEALEPSVSLNVFAPRADVARHAAEVLSSPPPRALLDDETTAAEKLDALEDALRAEWGALAPQSAESLARFATRMHSARFAPLGALGTNPAAAAAAAAAAAEDALLHCGDAALNTNSSSSSSSSSSLRERDASAERRAYLGRLAAMDACRLAAGPDAADGVNEIVLAHLLELWVLRFVLNGGHAAAELADLAACLRRLGTDRRPPSPSSA